MSAALGQGISCRLTPFRARDHMSPRKRRDTAANYFLHDCCRSLSFPWFSPLPFLSFLASSRALERGREKRGGECPPHELDLASSLFNRQVAHALVDIFLLLLFHIFSLKKREKREEEDRELTARYHVLSRSGCLFSMA